MSSKTPGPASKDLSSNTSSESLSLTNGPSSYAKKKKQTSNPMRSSSSSSSSAAASIRSNRLFDKSSLQDVGSADSLMLGDLPPSSSLSSMIPSSSDKQNLCIETLVSGYVNSFVDFFYLTHRSDQEQDALRLRGAIPDEHLPKIKDNLTAAERAHRRGDSESVYDAYEKLANYFRENNDHKTAIYFYEKCLDIAESVQDLAQQGNSNLHLGLSHESMGDISAAIGFHERHLSIATRLGDETRIQSANRQLVESYRRLAEEHERRDEHVEAVSLYKKCLQSASDASDLRSEGMATYRLGVACAAMSDRSQSIDYQQKYLNICKRLGDQLGEGAACAALANSFREMGDKKLAIQYLEKYHSIASRNKQSVACAEACAALGAIYSEQGDHVTAVNYFEKTFEIARSVGDRKLVDAARINLGMARGNMAMGKYMNVVKDNLPALLNWKTRRAPVK